MDNSKFKGKVASFSTITLDTSQTSADVSILGDCVKVETCSMGSVLQLKTSEGENPVAPLGRTWYSEKGFNSLKISGYQPNEVVEVTVGWGFITDTPGQNPLVPSYVAPGLIKYGGTIPSAGQITIHVLPGTVGYIETSGTAGTHFSVQGSFPGSIYDNGNGQQSHLWDLADVDAGVSALPGQYHFNATGFTSITLSTPDAHPMNFNLFIAGVGLVTSH